MPTVARARPSTQASSVFTGLSPTMPARQAIANTMSTKYSAGPKASAQFASSGARNTSPVHASSDPQNDANAEIDSATPASPFLAIGKPSSVVITEPASPGMLTRIDVIRPPYSQPM